MVRKYSDIKCKRCIFRCISTFRCILWGISRNEGLRTLNSSVVENKGVLQLGKDSSK